MKRRESGSDGYGKGGLELKVKMLSWPGAQRRKVASAKSRRNATGGVGEKKKKDKLSQRPAIGIGMPPVYTPIVRGADARQARRDLLVGEKELQVHPTWAKLPFSLDLE